MVHSSQPPSSSVHLPWPSLSSSRPLSLSLQTISPPIHPYRFLSHPRRSTGSYDQRQLTKTLTSHSCSKDSQVAGGGSTVVDDRRWVEEDTRNGRFSTTVKWSSPATFDGDSWLQDVPFNPMIVRVPFVLDETGRIVKHAFRDKLSKTLTLDSSQRRPYF